jgi:hypothetical protein
MTTRSIETRLRDIEARLSPGALRPSHRIIANTADECEATMEAMIANGQADRSDGFIYRVLVAP